MLDYQKTGEDNNYEYYSNVSEVESEEGDDEIYIKILNKRNEFNIKILNKEIKIQKRSLNKIMILSQSQPEEQVLFSLYKVIPKNSDEINKLKNKVNKKDNNDIIISEISTKENKDNTINTNQNENENKINITNKIVDDPLSAETPTPFGKNNNDNNQLIINNDINVINIPTDDKEDNEELAFRKDLNLDAEVIVGLPPEAIKTKCFYLLLTFIGISYVIIFLIGIFNSDVGLNLYITSLFIVGIEIFVTGALGFVKINKRIYNNVLVVILTIISLFAGIVGAIIVNLDEKTERYFSVSLIFGIISFCFSLLCLFWTNKLRKNILINRTQKAEKLV